MTSPTRFDTKPWAFLPPGLVVVALGVLLLSGRLNLTGALGLALLLSWWALVLLFKRSAALCRKGRTLQLAIDRADDAMVILDSSRAIAYENEAFRRAFPGSRPPKLCLSRFVIDAFEADGLAPLTAAIETASAWRGRVAAKADGTSQTVPQWFELAISPVAALDASETATLVTLRNVTGHIESERLRRLEEQSEKTRIGIALAMAVEAPLAERCSASLASVCQMEGMEALRMGAVFVHSLDGNAIELLSHCGDFGERFLNAPSSPQKSPCSCVMQEGRLVVIDSCTGKARVPCCDVDTPHGHYIVPLLARHGGEVLGALLLYTSERPIRDASRLAALSAIGELFANAVVRERTARLLVETSQKAAEATLAKSEFLATMSHEIRTPMNGVLGFTQLLLESSLSDEQREYVQLIYNSGEALLSLLNDILDFSRIEAAKLVIDPRPAAILETSREAVDLLRATAAQKGVGLRFHAGEGVPRGLFIDAMRFRQVLLNLAGNAVKFTPSGTVDVSLEVEIDEGSRWLRAEVKDSGIGISPEALPNLFNRFVQAETSTTRRFGGSGLGLAISKRLVELMGGSIGATSVEGVGSTFWFRLPFVEAVLEGGRRSESVVTRAVQHRRVLLAEDNPINQMLAKRVLEKMAAEVTIAPNGTRAVELVKAGDFDLILMDCQMPEMDGYDATRAIRQWETQRDRGGGRRALLIVAVTASAFADDIQRCLDAGMDAVLTKPFKLGDLEKTLSRFHQTMPLACISSGEVGECPRSDHAACGQSRHDTR